MVTNSYGNQLVGASGRQGVGAPAARAVGHAGALAARRKKRSHKKHREAVLRAVGRNFFFPFSFDRCAHWAHRSNALVSFDRCAHWAHRSNGSTTCGWPKKRIAEGEKTYRRRRKNEKKLENYSDRLSALYDKVPGRPRVQPRSGNGSTHVR